MKKKSDIHRRVPRGLSFSHATIQWCVHGALNRDRARVTQKHRTMKHNDNKVTPFAVAPSGPTEEDASMPCAYPVSTRLTSPPTNATKPSVNFVEHDMPRGEFASPTLGVVHRASRAAAAFSAANLVVACLTFVIALLVALSNKGDISVFSDKVRTSSPTVLSMR